MASMDPEEPVHYVVQHVRDALAGIGELELEVTIRGDSLFVTGTVQTEERRTAVAEAAGRTAPDLEIHNQVRVTGPGTPGGADVEHVS
jgi:HSP20 family molecular chaperone IbpA